MTEETMELWLDHPVVRRSFERSDDTVGMLECLYETLTELDDRFPGMSMHSILSARNPGVRRSGLVDRMREAGVTQENIDTLLGPREALEAGGPERVFEAVAAGATYRDLIRSGLANSPSTAKYWVSVRTPLTELERDALEELERSPGLSRAELARRLGVSRTTIERARHKALYGAWLGREQVAA